MQEFTLNDDLPADMRKPVERLTVDLIPSTSWWKNVRSEMPKSKWDKLRRKSYKNANYQCEVCGDSGFDQGYRWPVECHEIWEFDEATKTQRLVRLTALCPRCHEVKHFGLAQIRGRAKQAFQHLMKVNDWTKEEALQHVRQANAVYQKRSQVKWKLNLDAIEELS